jgi:uncharacterized protein
MKRTLNVAMLAFLAVPLLAQDAMDIETYKPKSSLVVPAHEVTRAKFPFIDVHAHQRRDMTPEQVDALLAEMDKLNMRVMVNLSGGAGENFRQATETFLTRHPGRFILFANVDLSRIDEPDFAAVATKQLERTSAPAPGG